MHLLKSIEANHLKVIEELENLYEYKLEIESKKYLELEQLVLEERMKFDCKLKKIETKHDANIDFLKN